MFENPEIPLDELPGTERLSWRSLDDRYLRVLQLHALLSTAIFVSVLVVLQLAPLPLTVRWPFAIAWLLVIGAAVRGLTWPMVSLPKKAYSLRDRDILFKSGVFRRTVTAVPFNRIQHVETSSTPLERHFALATLQLFTAGGSGADLKIPGLPADFAERLRLFILEKTGTSIEQ